MNASASDWSLECAPGALETIHVRAVLGRACVADDFRAGAEHVVMINVAVLMRLRALRRQKETAVGVALGAAPHRIARLLLRKRRALVASLASTR